MKREMMRYPERSRVNKRHMSRKIKVCEPTACCPDGLRLQALLLLLIHFSFFFFLIS